MKIRTLLLLYLVNVLILACSHSTPLKQEGELYAVYQDYAALLKTDHGYNMRQSQQILATYTPRKQETLVNSQIKTVAFLNELVDSYLTFPLWIDKEFNHYESMNGEQGCLLLNGYNQQREPMAITVSYSRANDWLIDDVHVEYLAPFNRFHRQAICDRRKLDEIRLKEMM